MLPNRSINDTRRAARAIGERYAQRVAPLPTLPLGTDAAQVFTTAIDAGYTELAQAALIRLACTVRCDEYRAYADRFSALQETPV